MQFIFDLDGTLLDSQEGVLSSLEYSIKKHAPLYLNNLHKVLIGPPILDILSAFISDKDLIRVIAKEFRVHYDNQGILKTKLFPSVRTGLKELSIGNELFISTNKPWVPTKKILTLLSIDSLFHQVITIDSGNFINKSEIVKKILYANKVSSSIVVGDSIDDYNSAKSNNIDFVYCSYGYGDVHLRDKDMTTASTSDSLFEILNSI